MPRNPDPIEKLRRALEATAGPSQPMPERTDRFSEAKLAQLISPEPGRGAAIGRVEDLMERAAAFSQLHERPAQPVSTMTAETPPTPEAQPDIEMPSERDAAIRALTIASAFPLEMFGPAAFSGLAKMAGRAKRAIQPYTTGIMTTSGQRHRVPLSRLIAAKLPGPVDRALLARRGVWHGSRDPIELFLSGPRGSLDVERYRHLTSDELGKALIRTTPDIRTAAGFAEDIGQYPKLLLRIRLDPSRVKEGFRLASETDINDYQGLVDALRASAGRRDPGSHVGTRLVAEKFPVVDARHLGQYITSEGSNFGIGPLGPSRLGGSTGAGSNFPAGDLVMAARERQLAIQHPDVVTGMELVPVNVSYRAPRGRGDMKPLVHVGRPIASARYEGGMQVGRTIYEPYTMKDVQRLFPAKYAKHQAEIRGYTTEQYLEKSLTKLQRAFAKLQKRAAGTGQMPYANPRWTPSQYAQRVREDPHQFGFPEEPF